MSGPTAAWILLHFFFFSSWWRKSLVLRSPDHIPAAQWPSAAHGPSLLRAQGLWASGLEGEWQGNFHPDFSLNKHYLI